MTRRPKQAPSFFRIYDSNDEFLEIPAAFMAKHLPHPERNKKNSFTLIRSEEDKAPEWAVKIGKIGESAYGFKLGWSEFAEDNDLEGDDFLLFWFIRPASFLVAVYDPSCCEKLPSIHPPSPATNTSDDIPGHTTSPVCFEAVLTKSSTYTMGLPVEFARETGIAARESIVLRNEQGADWDVSVRGRSNGYGYEMAAGWSDFRKSNNFIIGDRFMFRFNPEKANLIRVSLLERKAPSRWVRGSGSKN